MQYFSSSAIRAAGYDARSLVLSIQFTSGPRIYSYFGVPASIWQGFLAASSKGRYYDQHIKPYYRAT